jgi:hypothetical protein
MRRSPSRQRLKGCVSAAAAGKPSVSPARHEVRPLGAGDAEAVESTDEAPQICRSICNTPSGSTAAGLRTTCPAPGRFSRGFVCPPPKPTTLQARRHTCASVWPGEGRSRRPFRDRPARAHRAHHTHHTHHTRHAQGRVGQGLGGPSHGLWRAWGVWRVARERTGSWPDIQAPRPIPRAASRPRLIWLPAAAPSARWPGRRARGVTGVTGPNRRRNGSGDGGSHCGAPAIFATDCRRATLS